MSKPPFILKAPPFFGKPRRPSFDLTDALEFLKSPTPPSGSTSARSRQSRGGNDSFLTDDFIQHHLKIGIKNSAGNLVLPRRNRNSTEDKRASCGGKVGSNEEKSTSVVDEGESSVNKVSGSNI